MEPILSEKAKNLEVLLGIYNEMVGLSIFTDYGAYEKILSLVRTLFQKPDMMLGISIFFQKGNRKHELIRLMMSDHKYKTSDIKQIYRDAIHYSNKHYEDSIYFQAREKTYHLVEDLTKLEKNGINYWLMRRGIKGILVIPLKQEKEVFGFLELSSINELNLESTDLENLNKLIPAFTNTVLGFLLALKAELHALIQKHFTAIHPSVEWMFEDLAVEWLKGEDDSSIISPISLEKIYSLYGMSDIRGSSDLRRHAIQQDLKAQIELAQQIILASKKIQGFDQFEFLNFRFNAFKEVLASTIKVSDEYSVLQFLKDEFEIYMDKFKDCSPEAGTLCAHYIENLSETGSFYRNRKKFEASVHDMNFALNTFLTEEQDRMQVLYPHFFEKHITDGVDHSIYIGSAMNFGRNFSLFHLKSLKLWQLKFLCKSALIGELVKKNLGIPLELAHLVVSQTDPVTIYFDLQEKKFKVEGTYNIRFEIVKKRIDKARIKNTQERLTQPGTLAIVYSLDRDREEYLAYFDFLVHAGYIKRGVGDYVLEDMQGIEGLRALRVQVDLKKLAEQSNMESILGKLYGKK